MFEKIEIVDYAELNGADFNMKNKLALFYATGVLLESGAVGKVDMVNLLAKLFKARGYHCVFVRGADDIFMNERVNCAHVWMKDSYPKTRDIENLVYLMPSYLRGFWYLSKTGVRNLSHIASKDYNPEDVKDDRAQLFFDKLYQDYVVKGRTKWKQIAKGTVQIPDDCIFVAAQGVWTAAEYDRYVDFPELAQAVVRARGGRPVWIKPHPKMDFETVMKLAELHDPDNGIFFEDCNLHEGLSKAQLVVTRCSAVAVEAMLHKVPAIVSAQVDFHHGVEVLHEEEGMEAAINAALSRDFSYEKYLFWFFRHQHIEPSKPVQAMRQIERVFKKLK